MDNITLIVSDLSQTCYYCKVKGASIGCCCKSCRKSFHLHCALNNKCLVQFRDDYTTYCHGHHKIERSSLHSKNEMCRLCSQKMEEFHAVTSVELKCCGSKWYHIHCLRKRAYIELDDFCCPNCGNCDVFQDYMLSNGVYIHEK